MNIAFRNDGIYINGRYYHYPGRKKYCHYVCNIWNKVFVDGYELKNGRWRITIASVWHYLF